MIKNFKIEALWDCIYCNTEGIGGSLHSCPNCGNPRGKEVTFYLTSNCSVAHAVDENQVKISSGPDWLCAYCGRYNRSDDEVCKNCAAHREEAEKNYFQIKMQEQK